MDHRVPILQRAAGVRIQRWLAVNVSYPYPGYTFTIMRIHLGDFIIANPYLNPDGFMAGFMV
jgi:hypothetical protein